MLKSEFMSQVSLKSQSGELATRRALPVVSLAQLRPRPGEPVRLETRLPKGRYSVRLVGIHDQSAVIVTAPKSRKPLLTEGVSLNVKLLCGNTLISFSTRLLKARSEPFPHWILAYPTALDTVPFRQHTRVPVHLNLLLDKGDADPHAAQTALCVDISLSGASVESPMALAAVGDSVFLTARVSVAGIDHVILAPARVRSVMQTESGSLKVYRHGMLFDEMEEETRLVLAGYVYQQWLYECGELHDTESFTLL
jgi:c-di-GMP-binding flagellar brake protein YcgR